MNGAIAYFVTIRGTLEPGADFASWFEAGPASALKTLPSLRAFDLYLPEASDDPYLDDGAGPLVMAQLYFDDVTALQAALASATFPEEALKGEGGPAGDVHAAHSVMRAHLYPVAGERTPAPLTAATSYVVRYHRPVEDEAGFNAHYVKLHPPILGEFPGIRNVICYLPVAWSDPTGLEDADIFLGNEVVFDSLAALDAALASDVRHKLREDYKTFPPFTGRNTHYAMRRARLFG
ncbi:MAG: hypothetical protein ACTSUD_10380 [Alphaproteobacteria bacterium]